MKIRTMEISVGAFILAGILALTFLAIKVSGLNVNDSTATTYKLYAHFNNAAGLTPGAQVTVAGVMIGRVSAIELDPKDNRAKIEMAIKTDVDFLTLDSIAAIQTAGILGEKYVSIVVGGDPDVLEDGDNIVDTQSALVLEDLISTVLTSLGGKEE
ncbi:MAG: outer membrane lipid asymmetry maintenance protein MlaD [Cellvibrio sp.]|uniref:outer membrane lipid asymmetry maintenance protein MlaD n=1 Tax=Cellvibrio sp. TaxID=1965322 RepID=UPI002721CBB8|nr:outer membrane lipid asymmetry maintenance protein MlaD [Cellvibrio sp.]